MTSRIITMALLAALAAALWFYRGIAAHYGLFGGSLAFALDVAASIATGCVGVLLAAEVVAGLVIPLLTASRPTGFERAGSYLVFTLAAFILILAHFGFDVTTVLATSAVLTAIIGLALQPTLGAFIAGFALNADRVLKVGDGLFQNGETLVVTAIGWRSVTCTRGDGSRTVLTNSRVLDSAFDIVPADTPLRAELHLVASLSIEPQRIAASIANTLAELPVVDPGRDIAVVPIAFDSEKAQARYRIRCWTHSRAARDLFSQQAFTRIWYAFQREGFEWPVSADFSADFRTRQPVLTSRLWMARLAEALDCAAADNQTFAEVSAQTIAETGTLLLYCDEERIVIPERFGECRFLVVQGTPREERSHRRAQPRTTDQIARRGELARITRRLARVIGPYAEVAVARAALDEPSLARVRDTVACEIDDEAERRAFVIVDGTEQPAGLGVGAVFSCRRNAEGLLQPDPPLRAEGEVAIVGFVSCGRATRL